MARRIFRGLTVIMTIAMLALMSHAVMAQGDGGGDDGGGGGGDDGGDGDGGDVDDGVGGILIDAKGVLRANTLFDDTRGLDRMRAKAAMARLDAQLSQATDMRFVSLRRLEEKVESYIEKNQPIPQDIKYLAGMTGLTHVFLFPEEQDIVIAGPAEGFYRNAKNEVVGIKSNKPVLRLQDLVTALRAFGPDGKSAPVISCSIDPTQEGIARFQQAVSQVQSVASTNRRFSDTQTLDIFRNAIGKQVITIKGISPKTRMAHVLVNADYHMKLIGLGLERPPVKITTFIEKTRPMSGNTLFRWYFQPEYECVKVNEDSTAMQLVDGGVELLTASEVTNRKGERKAAGKGNRASRIFCNSFNKAYDKLAEATPLYAELKNVMDLSIAAAFIQANRFYEKSGWDMAILGDESQYRTETLSVPKFVDPVISGKREGNLFTTPIGGGVNIQPRVAVSTSRLQKDNDGKLQSTKEEVAMGHLQEGQWWWD